MPHMARRDRRKLAGNRACAIQGKAYASHKDAERGEACRLKSNMVLKCLKASDEEVHVEDPNSNAIGEHGGGYGDFVESRCGRACPSKSVRRGEAFAPAGAGVS